MLTLWFVKKTLTRKEVVQRIKHDQGERSLRQFAADLGVSAPYLSDIFLGKRDPGPAVLGHYGLRREEVKEIRYVAASSSTAVKPH